MELLGRNEGTGPFRFQHYPEYCRRHAIIFREILAASASALLYDDVDVKPMQVKKDAPGGGAGRRRRDALFLFSCAFGGSRASSCAAFARRSRGASAVRH